MESKLFHNFLNKPVNNKYINNKLWDPEEDIKKLNDPNNKIPQDSMTAKYMIQLDNGNKLPSYQDWRLASQNNTGFIKYRISNTPSINDKSNFRTNANNTYKIQDSKPNVPIANKPRIRNNLKKNDQNKYRNKYASDVIGYA